MKRTPSFPRSLLLGLEEVRLIHRTFQHQPSVTPVMLDVGAHYGTSAQPFAESGWRVHAFEPDPHNREKLQERLGGFTNVAISESAVSDVDGQLRPLYRSEESSGISSLIAFASSHRAALHVETVRLDTYLAKHGIDRVDFLKIDTEGYDLMVLRSFPWHLLMPDFVLCEYEDRKTRHLGYRSTNLIEFLVERDYNLLVSEWHPIDRYGAVHSFARLREYEGRPPPSDSWGNLIALSSRYQADTLIDMVPELLQVRAAADESRVQRFIFEMWLKASRCRRRAG